MKSILVQVIVAVGVLLAASAASAPDQFVRDAFGVRDANAPQSFEEYDPEKELEFLSLKMDSETIEKGLREVRDDMDVRQDPITLQKPAIVPFGRAQFANTAARSFVFRTMDKHEANWILYPYNFTYIEPPPTSSELEKQDSSKTSSDSSVYVQGNQTFPDGAMISTMNTENFPLHTYINWVESKTDINLKKAKVVYDMNVAVLRIQAEREGDDGTYRSVDITAGSDAFCTAFQAAFSPKYDRCFVGFSQYDEYVKTYPVTRDKACFVFVTPDDIKNGRLQVNGQNFFGMLIIPDLMLDELSYVKKVASGFTQKIKDFVNSGGLVLTTGSGGFLAETWGLVTGGTFDSRYTMSSPRIKYQYLTGCNMVGLDEPVDGSEKEFKESTLCFSLPHDAQNSNMKESVIAIYDAPLMKKAPGDAGLTPVLYYKNISQYYRLMKHEIDTGIDVELDHSQSYPAVMYKSIGMGHLVVHMANPAYSSAYYQHIYNAFLLAAQRPIAIDNTISGGFNRTIPALEQFNLNISLNIVNYFTEGMKEAKLLVFTINGTEVDAPSGCSVLSKEDKDYPSSSPEKVNVADVYSCSVGALEKLSNHSFSFHVKIVDVLITQQKQDIVVLWPQLEYKDPTRGNQIVTVSYGVKIQAAMSALLRADMNIDPSSWYPLHCDGTYIDNVMNCENKEETYALHVQHVGIVPLISPLIDISDQIRLAYALELDKDYYEKSVNHVGLWNFPYNKTADPRDRDFLDWDLLIDRSDLLCADWDEGVKLFRKPRQQFGLAPPRGDDPRAIMNSNYQTNNDNDTFLLEQLDFHDSDKFYEHAVQRLMAFLDVSTEEGANTYWGGNIPEEERSASNPDAGKRRILFVRHDLYFYKKYVLPHGLDKSYINKYFTLDKYDKNDVGDQRSFPGKFNNADGLIPAEYPNKLQFTGRTPVNMTEESIEELSGGGVKVVHYVVPIHKEDGAKAGDFYHFDADTGRHLLYPDVMFINTFSLIENVAPEFSRRGGDIVLTFEENDLPWDDISAAVKNDFISVSADQIAVYEMAAESKNQLRIRFKRGQMPNEAYGRPSHLQIFFENCKWVDNGEKSADRSITMDLYEMHYDLSKPETGYEDWKDHKYTKKVTFSWTAALRMPALRLQFVLNGDLENSFMNPYELREPLVRYGLYEQELESHRAVHGSAEFHPISEPSVVTKNGGFSTFTHVGTSSVPFREYVSTGTSLQIPAASETGRVEWDDIWGRHFVQNVRSTIFEYPPIPPPLRNFVMTTTFEILDKEGNRMLGGWHSNEGVDVHVQMKLLNNYPKWFEITACEDNRVLQDCSQDRRCGVARVYDTDDNLHYPPNSDNDDGTLYFKRGQKASYGVCFAKGKARLEGQELSEDDMKHITEMTFCASHLDGEDRTCEHAYPGLPVLVHVPDEEKPKINGSKWNYASRVFDYWPEGYIKENMWDLTHYDYDDNQFDKAYKYHMDNNLPHLGHYNTRPDNLISFPLFKGLGYSMVYNNTYTNKRFTKKYDYRGWWSDNLQNRDHTLVAGNEKSNDVSVGQDSLIPDDKWIDIDKLRNTEKVDGTTLASEAQKNVYTCLFNRRNVKNYLSNTKVTELFNVYENNVVPVPIDFNDEMEKRFKCDGNEWYTPVNISKYPNIVYTETPRDWLYFGANLRGGALEDINVIYQLNPLEDDVIKYEGPAKVQDGGRFVYWNPANSKNSYLVVDNPVHIVLAKRNDIEIAQELIPSYTTTFDSVVYHHFTISDPEEIEREWESPIYTNNYGYGDFTVQVYVGDAGTTALPSPSKTIRARFTFMNNAGFDINLLKNAINSTEVSQESINAYEMMKNIIRTLRRPDAYNFLDFQIPDELKPYIRIYPCPDVVGIAGLFFDFDSINVVTIRDGWKADYYVNIEISPDFPDELRGRLLEIPVKLVREYFDALPGEGDVTGAHDYTVEVPSIFLGVPYPEGSLWEGKVFYTSGYATSLDLRAELAKPYSADKAIIVSEEDVEEYRACLLNEQGLDEFNRTIGEFTCLDRLFDAQLEDHDLCEYSIVDDTSSRQTVSFAPCMEKFAPTFPVKVPPKEGPDHAEMHVLLRTHAAQVPRGDPAASNNAIIKYKDWMNQPLDYSVPKYTVHSKGAWITLGWSVSLLSTSGMVLSDPLISPNNSGLAQIRMTVNNEGDYFAYNVKVNLTIVADVRVATEKDMDTAAGAPIPEDCKVTQLSKGKTMFSCDVDPVLPYGYKKSFDFRVFYNKDTRSGAGASAKYPLNMRVIAEESSASIDLTATAGEKHVTQDLAGPFGIKYTSRIDGNMVVLTGRRTSEYGLILTASHKLDRIRAYIWRAKLRNATTWTTIAVTTDNTLQEYVSERFEKLGGKKTDEVAVDYICAVSRQKSPKVTIDNCDTVKILTQSNVYEWRVANSNLLLLLLLLPGLAIPALAAAAIFATTKGKNKEPVRELGMAPKQKFVPQELVDEEPIPMTETDVSAPPPTLPQRAAPAYEPPEPAPQAAQPGKAYAIPTGPTYLRAGVPVNVIDN